MIGDFMSIIDNQDIEAISKILGEELNGTTITSMFKDLGFKDHDIERGFTWTKWRRINESTSEMCDKTNNASPLFNVIEYVSKPSRYVNSPEKWKSLLKSINSILIFKGYELKDDGRVFQLKL